MRCAIFILIASLLLAGLPAGAQAGDPLWTHPVPSGITELSLTPDGSYVLVAGERLCLLAGNGTALWKQWTADVAAFSADGSRIVVAHGSSLTLVTRGGVQVWKRDLPAACVTLGISADGKRIAAADRFGRVYFYDGDGNLRATADTRGKSAASSEIRAVDLSGDYVGVASTGGLFYYSGTGKKVWAREGMLESSTAVAVSENGSVVAAGSDTGVRLLDRAGKVLWTYRCHRPVTALAISGDGSRVAFGMQDNTLTCLDREGEEVWTFSAGGWIRDIALSTNGSRVLAGGTDRQVYLFDGAGRLLDSCELPGWVNHVAISADGTKGVAATPHEVAGVAVPTGTATATAIPETPTPATPPETPATPETLTPSPVNATASLPEEGIGLPLLVTGILASGVMAGAGYLYLQRRRPSPGTEGEVPKAAGEKPLSAAAVEEPLPVIEEASSAPWRASLERRDMRGAARVLSREMTALIRERTGARVLFTADALEACPGQREALAGFFADADRLAYGPVDPVREDIEALEAAYLRLAGEI